MRNTKGLLRIDVVTTIGWWTIAAFTVGFLVAIAMTSSPWFSTLAAFVCASAATIRVRFSREPDNG